MEPNFSCCHLFNECDYGRKECSFAETKPDMKERCRCYHLKRAKGTETVEREEVRTEKFITDIVDENEENLSLEQLSLF